MRRPGSGNWAADPEFETQSNFVQWDGRFELEPTEAGRDSAPCWGSRSTRPPSSPTSRNAPWAPAADRRVEGREMDHDLAAFLGDR